MYGFILDHKHIYNNDNKEKIENIDPQLSLVSNIVILNVKVCGSLQTFCFQELCMLDRSRGPMTPLWRVL